MGLLGPSFQIGRSALAAYQAAIAVVGQNIANVGNPCFHASAIRARAHALVRIAEDLRRSNKLAAMVARDLQGHIRGVFTSVSEAGSESVGYDPRGQQRRTKPTAWLDAVG